MDQKEIISLAEQVGKQEAEDVSSLIDQTDVSFAKAARFYCSHVKGMCW